MTASAIQTLLAAVRRHLWRGQFIAAIRRALWGSAALALLCIAVHLLVRPVAVAAMLGAVALAWASQLAWAGWRRPADPACALWADRHLGGASAFATWLEVGTAEPGAVHAAAARRLEQWALARAPGSLQRLAERRAAAPLVRPLLSMLTCTALAALVLTLPADPASAPRTHAAASSAAGAAERPLAFAEAPSAGALASDMASALRVAPPQVATAHRADGAGLAGGQGQPDDGHAAAQSQPGAVAAAGEPTARRDSAAGVVVESPLPAPAGAAPTTGAGSGREAGQGRDERAEVGQSQALRGTIAIRGVESKALRATTERQADMDRAAAYDADPARQAAAPGPPARAAAAATPPADAESTRLTSTETTYVQAWMKATARRR